MSASSDGRMADREKIDSARASARRKTVLTGDEIAKAERKTLHRFKSKENVHGGIYDEHNVLQESHSYISTEGWGDNPINVKIDGHVWKMGLNKTALHFWTVNKENVKVFPRTAITMIEVVDTDEVYQGGGPLLKCLARCCGCKCVLPPPVISKGSLLVIYTSQSSAPAKEVHMNDEDIPYVQQLLDTVI